jgi:hypothetical protein
VLVFTIFTLAGLVMTPQTLVNIDFAEIASIEITCRCGGRLTVPLPTLKLSEKLKCPGCTTPLWNEDHDARYNAATGVAEAISVWKKLNHDGFRLGFSIPQE